MVKMKLVANSLAVAKFTQQWSQWHNEFQPQIDEIVLSYDCAGGAQRYWLAPDWTPGQRMFVAWRDGFPEGKIPTTRDPYEGKKSPEWAHVLLSSDPAEWCGAGFAFESGRSGVVAAFMPHTDGVWNVTVIADAGERSYYCDFLVDMLSDDTLKTESEAETVTCLRELSVPAIAPVTYADLSALSFGHSRKYEKEEWAEVEATPVSIEVEKFLEKRLSTEEVSLLHEFMVHPAYEYLVEAIEDEERPSPEDGWERNFEAEGSRFWFLNHGYLPGRHEFFWRRAVHVG